MKYLEKILTIDPVFLDGYRRLGKLYIETNQREKAVKIFYNSIEKFQDEPRVRLEMLERIFLSTPSEDSTKLKTLKDFTDELIRDKNLIKAEELLKDTAALLPDNKLTVELGKIQYKLGKFDNVITQLEDLDKNNLEGKYYLGATYFIQGNIDKSLIFFTQIIDFNEHISQLSHAEKIKRLKAVEIEGETDAITMGIYNSLLYNSIARAGEIYRRRGLIEPCEKLFLQLVENGSRNIDDTILDFFSSLSSDFSKINDEREYFWKNQITKLGQSIIKKKQSKTSYEDFWLLFSPSEPGPDDIIGEGGMAIVYRGIEVKTGRNVAIKKMHRNFCLSPEARSFFHKEVSVMETLSRPAPHPKIVEFIAHGISDDRFVFAMELVDGKSLRDKLIEGEIKNFNDIYSIIIQICAGLEKTHEENIIHRDLKPENILITIEGSVKLTDFGICRITSLTTSTRHNYQRTKSFVGTSYYSAPEQYPDPYDGKLPPIDNRADIYSLGCIIYEMVTTQPPFLHDDPGIVGLMHQRRSTDGKSVTEIITPGVKNPLLLERFGLNQEQIKELDRIVMKCLKKNPIARYQSVNELKEDFIKLVNKS
jgi:tetratricopeptide (TPR) repeat protein